MSELQPILNWLNNNAEQVSSTIPNDPDKVWVTKLRGEYITRVGMEADLEYLMELGITDEVSSSWSPGSPVNIGFNPTEQKWFGWSHRAIFGFGIGSTCKKGDCHYIPVDKDDFLLETVKFWEDDFHLNTRGEHTDEGLKISWEYSHDIPNENVRGQTVSIIALYPDVYGKGEWTAKTLEDAKQMAKDFAEGVS